MPGKNVSDPGRLFLKYKTRSVFTQTTIFVAKETNEAKLRKEWDSCLKNINSECKCCGINVITTAVRYYNWFGLHEC